MATLAAPVPGLADGDGGLRAPGAARRRALPRDAGPRTRRRRAGRKRPAYDAALAAWQDVLGGPAARWSSPPPARTTSAARSRWPTSSRSRSPSRRAPAGAARGRPGQGAQAAAAGQRELRPAAGRRASSAAPTTTRSGARSRRRRRTRPRCTRPGVPFALVSGHAPDFLAGVRKAIERGLPREAALRAVTLSAAEALGVADRTGQPRGGQDRERGRLVGRAADQGREARRWCSWTASSTSRTRSRRPAPRRHRPTPAPVTVPTPSPSTDAGPDAGGAPMTAVALAVLALAAAAVARRADDDLRHHGRHHPHRGPAGHDPERAPCSSATARSPPSAPDVPVPAGDCR